MGDRIYTGAEASDRQASETCADLRRQLQAVTAERDSLLAYIELAEVADRAAGGPMSSRTPGAPSPLRLARQLRAMEIADVARALGNSPAWVGAMELGRRPIPARTLPRLARVLGVPVGMLTGEAVTLTLESSDSDRPPPHRWRVRLSGLPAPALRDGQRLWNALAAVMPKAVEPMRGGPCDPYHDDSRIPAFLRAVAARRTQDAVDARIAEDEGEYGAFGEAVGATETPRRYIATGRETIDSQRDLAYATARVLAGRGCLAAAEMADRLFGYLCMAQTLRYDQRKGLKGDAAEDAAKSEWYVKMYRHVIHGEPDPRSGRPDFVPYARKPWGGA